MNVNVPVNRANLESYELAAASIRSSMGLKRLSPKLASEVRDAVDKHNNRRWAKLGATKPKTGVQLILDEQVQIAKNRVASIVRRHYKCSDSRRAGGETTVKVTAGKYGCAGGKSETAWSSNGKWRGSNAILSVRVDPFWVKRVDARDLAVLSGLLTTHAKPIPGSDGVELYEASWVEQGRGFDLNAKSGYIAVIREDDEIKHSYHASSAKAAIVGVRRKAGITQPRRNIDLDKWTKKYGHLPVRLEDSYRVGNCEMGTKSWMNAVGLKGEQASLAQVIAGYKLRPLVEALNVIRSVKRSAMQFANN